MSIKANGLNILLLPLAFAILPLCSNGTPPQEKQPIKANDVVAMIKSHVNCKWSEKTVDTFKAGNPEDLVTGIAVCMFADMEVLKAAVADGCNLIIAHEPTFYNHLDETSLLESDPVYALKIKYIKDNHLIIWRFHDHIHKTKTDLIYVGMVEKLGWADYQSDSTMTHFKLPGCTLLSLINQLKKTFPGSSFRVTGNPDLKVANIALSVGAPGFAKHLRFMEEKATDVLIAGEASEWETYQYAHDAQLQQRNKALIVLGHTISEEAGMDYCAKWLKSFIPRPMKIQFVKNSPSYVTY